MKNWPQTCLSQYSNSQALVTTLAAIDQWIQQDTNWELFYNNVMNIATAISHGLDVWARIVGVVRVVTLESGVFFGFSGSNGPSGTPFNNAPFYEGDLTTNNFTLTDDTFRQLIYAKAAANITNGSIPALNAILMNILFPNRGNAYVADGLNMTMTYTFEFALQDFEKAIVQNSGVLPRSTGVQVLYSYVF